MPQVRRSGRQWQGNFEGQPIRLLITARRDGYEPWTLLKDVFEGRADAEERKQAEQIDVSVRSIDGTQADVLPPDKGEPVHMVVVMNNSNRPVREVACQIEACSADMSVRHKREANV